MKEYNRRYREKNSDLMTCGCGATIKKISNYTHLATKKHLAWVELDAQIGASLDIG